MESSSNSKTMPGCLEHVDRAVSPVDNMSGARQEEPRPSKEEEQTPRGSVDETEVCTVTVNNIDTTVKKRGSECVVDHPRNVAPVETTQITDTTHASNPQQTILATEVTTSISQEHLETNLVRTVGQGTMCPQQATPAEKTPSKKKKIKKSIFISYSPDAGFVEKKFVIECVRQFKENNLAEDIWFDKDEKNMDSPCWFSQRIEAVERCRAAILFLSESYLKTHVSVYEAKILMDRQKRDSASVKVFTVLYNKSQEVEIPRTFQRFFAAKVDLTGDGTIKKSLAEKASVVVGTLMVEVESLALVNSPPAPFTPPDTDFTGEYKKKKMCHWGANDLQEWLFKLGIKEFYRQSLAENMVDGFLLMSVKDQDLLTYLGVDSRVVRKKIMQQILTALEREQKLPENWHLRAKTQRPKSNSIYLIYDPTDLRLAQNLKHDLSKKSFQVYHHQKLGTSKEEFLQLNGPQMAATTHVLVILTDAATNSPFVFHQVLFADWLGKKIVTAMFRNTWSSLRPSLRAVIGDCPAVDFERKLYAESLDVLEHHLKPFRAVPGVVLEQSFLTKMAEGIRSLAKLALESQVEAEATERNTKIFISFQWDMASKVDDIRARLEGAGFRCWADIGTSMGAVPPPPRGLSGLAGGGGVGGGGGWGQGGTISDQQVGLRDQPESLGTQIQCSMKAAGLVLCCITPKYMQSDNCVKDLTLADTLRKPIVPVMLRFCHWPPDGAPSPVKKILAKHTPVDLSNDKLFKQNICVLQDRIKKFTGNK